MFEPNKALFRSISTLLFGRKRKYVLTLPLISFVGSTMFKTFILFLSVVLLCLGESITPENFELAR